MPLATFLDITTAAQSSLARTDVPNHVYSLAHAEVCTRFRVREMEITAALSITAGDIYVTLPTGFKMMRHAYIGGDGIVEGTGGFSDGFSDGFETTVAYAAEVYTRLDQTTGFSVTQEFTENACPTSFAIVGTDTGPKMRFNTTPDEARTIIHTSVVAPSEMVNDTDTNLLLAAFPSAYLYSALRHAAIWAQDVELAQVYTAAYESEAARITKADRVSRYAAPLTSRPG
jgi:hypothetical protein